MSYALVTGASGGIGEGIARSLAANKRNLVLVARSKEKLDVISLELKEKYSVDVRVIASDLGKAGAAEDLFRQCLVQKLQVNCLINNAGIGILKGLTETSGSEMQNMLELNVTSLTQLTMLFANEMVRQKAHGIILNVASTAAFQPIPYMAAYAATKAYVLSFSQAADFEYSRLGVRVLTLCPGTTATQFFDTAGFDISKHRKFAQTTDEVVEVAMAMIEKGTTVKVSGWKNSLLATIAQFTPSSVSMKIGAKFMGR